MASPITVYTGGTCYPNQDPGPGAWAYVSIIDGQECEASGAHSATTAMRMHLTAAIKGLEAAERGRTVLMYTSSQVVQHGMMEWIHKWQRNGWRTSNGQPVDNQDLWERLYSLASGRTVQWEWLCDDMDRTAGTDKQTQRVHALACGALQGVAAGVVADQADDGEAEAVSGEPEAVDEPLDNREAIVVKEQRDCVGAEEARQLSGDDEQLAFSAECQALQLRWTHLHEEVVLLDQEWQRVLDAVNRCQEAKRNGQPLDWTAGAFMFARLGRHAGRMANIAAEARQTCEQYAKALQRAMEGIPEG
jgi:ribonuclease HI